MDERESNDSGPTAPRADPAAEPSWVDRIVAVTHWPDDRSAADGEGELLAGDG
ncbi:hypothetical protein ACIBM4_03440 [Streptomyces sp. NPDC050256]|uniref:hypothetical protein n=1 Tax=Streptomyces sp. NPDC050256 TaxID=3365607 RepID=UPI0037A39B3E